MSRTQRVTTCHTFTSCLVGQWDYMGVCCIEGLVTVGFLHVLLEFPEFPECVWRREQHCFLSYTNLFTEQIVLPVTLPFP